MENTKVKQYGCNRRVVWTLEPQKERDKKTERSYLKK